MAGEEDMKKTLQSVREAYRFLCEFQKRLNDTIERFRQEFRGYTYVYSLPLFRDLPLFRNRNQNECWTLDLFPTFVYSMQYEDYRPEPDEYSALLQISFYADSMYDGKEDLLPAETSDSKSTIEVYYWVTRKPLGENFDWPGCKEWRETKYTLGEVIEHNEDLNVIGIALDFEKLKDEEGIKGEADRVKQIIKDQLGFAFDN